MRGAAPRVLPREKVRPRLALVDNIECGEAIVARAKAQQAKIIDLPVAPVKQVRTRKRGTSTPRPEKRNGPVKTIKPNPLALERAHEIIAAQGCGHIKILGVDTVVVVNHLVPTGRRRR